MLEASSVRCRICARSNSAVCTAVHTAELDQLSKYAPLIRPANMGPDPDRCSDLLKKPAGYRSGIFGFCQRTGNPSAPDAMPMTIRTITHQGALRAEFFIIFLCGKLQMQSERFLFYPVPATSS